ncbi:mtnK [Acanthosepion pharaonis]|uniref:MtnK n=1 Tax=Acanthosepion pharaonis TaxID=158019 RepID=A0A812APG4_ACAPH|nr:mtnK [Sepia pharaonis]
MASRSADENLHFESDTINFQDILELLKRPEHDYSWSTGIKESHLEDLHLEMVHSGAFFSFYNLYNRKQVQTDHEVMIKVVKPFPQWFGNKERSLRLSYEQRVLQKLEEFCPTNKAIKIHLFVPGNSFAFIENLKGYRTLDDHLLSKDFSEDLAKAIINNLIHIHKATFFATSNSNCLEDLEAQLQDCGFPGIIEKMTFICSFEKDNPTKCKDESLEKVLLQIYNNSTLLSSVADLKNSFHTNKECLIHGNLQTDSILCSLNGDIKFAGFEFAHVGSCAFDMACILVNYLVAFYHFLEPSEHSDQNHQFAQSMIEYMKISGQLYIEKMHFRNDQVKKFWSEVAGFAGCVIIRRVLLPLPEDILHTDKFSKADVLEAGIRLLKNNTFLFSSLCSLIFLPFFTLFLPFSIFLFFFSFPTLL